MFHKIFDKTNYVNLEYSKSKYKSSRASNFGPTGL